MIFQSYDVIISKCRLLNTNQHFVLTLEMQLCGVQFGDVAILLSLFTGQSRPYFVLFYYKDLEAPVPCSSPTLLNFLYVLGGGKPPEAYHLQMVLLKRRLFQKVQGLKMGA